ncbi:uncharacterized protein LOC126374060 isoform X2 [Pectinophora gossypiella]|uniref:uncharacterized protein LOC126374060 isoform X2 n=1 Tax=Pectinophora gossypiella TaxID=13191 RepID=UPI00214F06B4|nr:uncharacterized protein LOC126374060 isoform X2 [Pectinophora gossypiella]
MEREVMAGDTPLGLRQLMQTSYVEVRREFSCCDHHFTVAAPECGHFLVAKGLTTKHVRDTQDQVVLGTNDAQVGVIKRDWTEYDVQFPKDLDVRYKGALIAACVFISIESQRRRH